MGRREIGKEIGKEDERMNRWEGGKTGGKERATKEGISGKKTRKKMKGEEK